MTLSLKNPYFRELADEHRSWLSTFDPQYLANWEKLLNCDVEAALCETGVRRRLQNCAVALEPCENLTGDCRGPDFRCQVGTIHFYVEVSCVSIAAAERKTGMKNEVSRKPSPFNVMGMAEAIFGKCGDKAPQCANLDGPALVAVGTFHAAAAMAGFSKILVGNVLTGKTSFSQNISLKTGEPVGDTYLSTDFEKAAFLRRDHDDSVGFKRSSISGVVVFGLGTLFGLQIAKVGSHVARAAHANENFGVTHDKPRISVGEHLG
jgi:hypothetical protein